MKEKIRNSRRPTQVIYRKDLRDLVSQKLSQQGKRRVVESARVDNRSPCQLYQVVNTVFSKTLRVNQRSTDRDLLKQAISEVKPCMDLRQVRRGRKVFQIPRVIPPSKRQLFGVRQLLYACASKSGQNVRLFQSADPSVHKRAENANKGRISQHSPQTLPNDAISVNAKEKHSLRESSSLVSKRQRPHTRATLLQDDRKVSLSPLASSLSQEIRACFLSRSRSIENKKRIYKTAFTNRGSIRLAWWL